MFPTALTLARRKALPNGYKSDFSSRDFQELERFFVGKSEH